MARKKKQDVAITVAIIAAIAGIIGAYLQGPLADTQWKERPIVDASFGGLDTDLPKKELQRDEGGYYVEIALRNRGKSDGTVIFLIQGVNTDVWSSQSKTWSQQQSSLFTIFPDPQSRTIKVYVKPNDNSNTFTVQLIKQEPSDKPQFQEYKVFRPTELTYEKVGNVYTLIDQR